MIDGPRPLRRRVAEHYDVLSGEYAELWGEHIHHGLYLRGDESRAEATEALLARVVEAARVEPGDRVLDVGCGVGGTARWLAGRLGCRVTGLTISPVQAGMAASRSAPRGRLRGPRRAGAEGERPDGSSAPPAGPLSPGSARAPFPRPRYLVGDASRLPVRGRFDAVLALEVLSHVDDRPELFHRVAGLLEPGGRLGVAAWLAADDLDAAAWRRHIEPIERGMLVRLPTAREYEQVVAGAGLRMVEWEDVSAAVRHTWDLCLEIVADRAVWALAVERGREVVAFVRSFRAMRRGFASGAFRYAVFAAERPGD